MKINIAAHVFIAMFIQLVVLTASAAEQCPAIDCDCNSLPEPSWVEVCAQHEQTIKQRCAANDNTPADYCLVHGLNAHPLPLSLSVGDVDASKMISLEDSYESIDGTSRIMTGSLEEAKSFHAQGKYADMLERLKVINSVIDLSFEQQQLVELTLIREGEKERKIARSWEKYAGKAAFAESLRTYGDELAAAIPSATNAKQKKIYSVLAKKAYRLAGKRFEQIGYSLGKADMHERSAQAWKQASEVSQALSNINRNYGGKASNIKFSEFQTAARLQRASYHWMLGKAGDNARQVLAQSQQYVDREEQQKIEKLVNTQNFVDEEQKISER